MVVEPKVAGMTTEVWCWLRDAFAVRPLVVVQVRDSLIAGHRPSADDVAAAMLMGPCRTGFIGSLPRGAMSPYRGAA